MDAAASMLHDGAMARSRATAELHDGVRQMAAAKARLDDLMGDITEREQRLSNDHVTSGCDTGLARVVVSGTGDVVMVELDPERYRRVTSAQICAAVMTALGKAKNKAAAEPDPVRESWPEDTSHLAGIIAQYRHAHEQFAADRIRTSSRHATVTAVHDGHGSLCDLRFNSRALIDYSFATLGQLITEAIRDGERASGEHRRKVQDSILVNGDTVGNWRRHPLDPGELVERAFGADLATIDPGRLR